MNFNNLFNMQGMLFAVMLLGLFLRKKGMITDEGKALLTDLVIDVTLPASILVSHSPVDNCSTWQKTSPSPTAPN